MELGGQQARIGRQTRQQDPPFEAALVAIDIYIVDQVNSVAIIVAGENSGRVSTVDLNEFLSVDEDYSPDIDGVPVRSNDDVHFSEEGADFVSAWLAPKLVLAADLAGTDVKDTGFDFEGADSNSSLGLASDGNVLPNADSAGRTCVGC